MSKDSATVIKDGQLAVATVPQTGTLVGAASEIDATALVETADGLQLCVKTCEVGGGGGGGGTVDQTYNPTSTNAQSGTAVAEAVSHIPSESIYYPQPLYKAYTIVGNDVTVDSNNIASGFKSYGNQQPDNSYLLLNSKIPSFTIMEIYMEFTCGNFNLDKGYPLFVNNTLIRDWYIQGNTSDNTAYYMRRWNGTTNVDGVTMLSSGQTYKTKYVFNKSNNNTETAYIMVNGSLVKQFEVTSATDWWTNNYFGIGGSYAYEQGFDGSINLNETAIYLDGNCFFNGAKNWIPSTAAITGVPGYDSTKTQVLKNVNGVLTWVDE